MEKAVERRVELPVELNVDTTVRQDLERCLNSADERERRSAELAIAYFQAPPEIQRQVIAILEERGYL